MGKSFGILSVAANSATVSLFEVTTVTREFEPSFFHAVVAIANSQTRAPAVVGSDSVGCNVQSPILCNPQAGTSRCPGAIPSVARSLWRLYR
jgi:hypothetical protein